MLTTMKSGYNLSIVIDCKNVYRYKEEIGNPDKNKFANIHIRI